MAYMKEEVLALLTKEVKRLAKKEARGADPIFWFCPSCSVQSEALALCAACIINPFSFVLACRCSLGC